MLVPTIQLHYLYQVHVVRGQLSDGGVERPSPDCIHLGCWSSFGAEGLSNLGQHEVVVFLPPLTEHQHLF